VTTHATSRTVGYIELIRRNRDFRRLFIGQVISQTGDWFNSVALFTLLLSLGGSGSSIGFVLILKLLPSFVVGPLAGVVADRFNRKTIMIVSDVARGIIVVGFLLVRRPDQLWIAYALAALQVIVSTFFDPAKSAALPSLVSREELIAANGLSSASWSVTLAIGAALGGVVTGAFGRDAAFAADSLSYFVSAAFISLTRFRWAEDPTKGEARTPKAKLSFSDATGIADLIEGARYLRANRRVMALMLVKSGWGLGGGVLLLLTIFGKEIFPIGRDGSISIGLLYAARGAGAMVGPIIAQAISGASSRAMRRTITVAFFISGVFYLLFAHAPVFGVAMLTVLGAHAGGSIQWVYSTTLLQLSVPNRFLGRVFAIELALLTLTMSLSTWLTGWGVDHAGVGARSMATVLGVVFLAPGLAWWAIQRRLDRSDATLLEGETESLTAEAPRETSFPPG